MELSTPVVTQQNSLATLMANILEYKYNPVMIQQTILDYLQTVTNGGVDIVDPTNPFVFLLESATVLTSAAISENELYTRRLYPSLATTMDDLYRHMSNSDFLNIFSTPSTGEFYFVIEKNSLLSSLVANPNTGNNELIIGGNTFVTVTNTPFSLQYPIVITQYPNGNIVINYDDSTPSPIQSLTGTNIPYNKRIDANGTEWYSFKVMMTQVSVDSSILPILDSTYFTTSISYDNLFYYCRVFNQADANGEWIELNTTFSEQVYNPTEPTAVLQMVGNNVINVSIPPVYVTEGLLSGNIRIDIYTTLGNINLNLSNYPVSSFITQFLDLNESTDNSQYYATTNNLIFLLYSDQIINGGSNGLSFSELRDQVINNSIGNPQLPITSSQLQTNLQNSGFNISLKSDTITDRIFVAYKGLPSPINLDFITPLSLTMESVSLSFNTIAEYSTINLNNSQTRASILPTTLYQNVNGVVSIYNNPNVAIFQQLNLTALKDLINSNNLLYSPFYYILDASEIEFKVRVYNLDSPKATNLGFYGVNSSSTPSVTTGQFQFTKYNKGYRLILLSNSNQAYQTLPMTSCGCQLSYVSPLTGNRNYIQGSLLGKNSAGENIFQFDIPTNYDVDSNDILYISGYNSNGLYTDIGINLLQDIDIIYYLTSIPSGFKPNSFQTFLNQNIIVNAATPVTVQLAAITHDVITLNFGINLNYLWAQYRSVMNDKVYSYYTRDIPLRYTQDEYQVNPAIGSILQFDSSGNPTFVKTATAGDIVTDKLGNEIIKYPQGSTIVDSEGNPNYLNYNEITRYVDIAMYDAAFYFVTNSNTQTYINSITTLITEWATTSLETIAETLMEQSEIYLYPQKNNTTVEVTLTNNTVVTIPTKQSLNIVFIVPNTVMTNLTLQKRIKAITTGLIYNYFESNTSISISQMSMIILSQFSNDLLDIQITGLGGSANYPYLSINDETVRLSISKSLVLLSDNTISVTESINYTFTTA